MFELLFETRETSEAGLSVALIAVLLSYLSVMVV